MIRSLSRIAAAAVMACVVLTQAGAEQTLEERRREVLKYGLEGEMVELVQKLRDEGDTSLDGELKDTFDKTRSPAIREAVLSLFSDRDNPALKEYCLGVLADPYDTKKSTVAAAFAYVEKLKITEAAPLARALLSEEKAQYRDLAIHALGKVGSSDDAVFLSEYLDSELAGDEKQRLIIRQNVMTALGELKSEVVWGRMAEIAGDEEENVMIRASAARAIGAIGKSEAIPVLTAVYEDGDPVLRAAAVNGLASFRETEAVSLIIAAFRDSNYKVRLEALDAAERAKLTEAVPSIAYRARTDPVEAVKMRAFEVLGTVNDAETLAWLAGLVRDEKSSDKIRIKAVSVLGKNDLDSIFPDLEALALQSLKDDKKTWIRYECGKFLSKKKDGRISTIASAYIQHKDPATKSLGMDMYDTNRFPDVRPLVEAIAANEKMGALQGRAKKILEKE